MKTPMKTPTKIRAERTYDETLLWIVLDAPKANVLDAAMLEEIQAILDDARARPSLKAIAFAASGPHFSFGASVDEHRADRAAEMLRTFHAVFRTLLDLSIPTFAAVSGACLGGGMELVSHCSWIFAHPEASFGQPEIKLAVFPPMASLLLPWRLRGGAAVDLCVSGRTIFAPEAHRLGLVHALDADPRAAVRAFFEEQLAPLSASSLRFAERAARLPLKARFERDLPALERLYLDELMRTPDANEGIEAFLSRRAPRYEP
ncbi:MAG: enoyl-CoA hydratase/isomerase family protein [Myxococcales bacterium]|nr:enoyl-CoA hydratase/isomerase family protein [Myxococcales bacterium]